MTMIIPMTFLPLRHRVNCAALIGIAGGAVAQTMSLWGGSLAKYLPDLLGLSLAAVAGAAAAGVLLADAFGHKGMRGALFTVVMWPLTTALGAAIGGWLFAVSPSHSIAYALEAGVSMGWWAVGDGIRTSPQVAIVWVLSGLAVHFAACFERARVT